MDDTSLTARLTELADQLTNSGRAAEARKLLAAVRGSLIPSEILIDAHEELRKISAQPLPEELAVAVKKLASEIDSRLSGSGIKMRRF